MTVKRFRFPVSTWIWMPHPAHYICATRCRFHMATVIGNRWIVSSVGEYLPPHFLRKIILNSRNLSVDQYLADDPYIQKVGFEPIGAYHKYETMVFRAKKTKMGCCPYEPKGPCLDSLTYNSPDEAAGGHRALCRKWADLERKPRKKEIL